LTASPVLDQGPATAADLNTCHVTAASLREIRSSAGCHGKAADEIFIITDP
jgi:hypothetical protein